MVTTDVEMQPNGQNHRWHVLGVFLGPPILAQESGSEHGVDAIEEVALPGIPYIKTEILQNPTLAEVKNAVATKKPTIVYIRGKIDPINDLKQACVGPLAFKTSEHGEPVEVTPLEVGGAVQNAEESVKIVILDVKRTDDHARSIYHAKVPYIIRWPTVDPMPALPMIQFSHGLFCTLRNPTATINEAFIFASHAVQVHITGLGHTLYDQTVLPELWGNEKPEMPTNATIPNPEVPGWDFSNGVAAVVQGWEHVRLLAPRAELRLQIAGHPPIVDAMRLGFLGQALRALLVFQMRTLTLKSMEPCQQHPSHLPENTKGVQCSIETSSGKPTTVVLGAPQTVLDTTQVVEHALRQTLVADSLSLQFRLPPPGVAAVSARCSPDVAHSCPVIDTLVITSLWTVHLLRLLCQDPEYRGLVSLGVVGVGSTKVAAFNKGDALRFGTAISGMEQISAVPQNYPLAPHAYDYGDMDIDMQQKDYQAGGDTLEPPANVPLWKSNRPNVKDCKEPEFLQDLIEFLESRGRRIDRQKFPDAIVNQRQLDLFNLYKEVQMRGGFKNDQQINWKGQIFPKMRNWTEYHKMTGIGNALKKHYKNFLWEYELAHPQDATPGGHTLP